MLIDPRRTVVPSAHSQSGVIISLSCIPKLSFSSNCASHPSSRGGIRASASRVTTSSTKAPRYRQDVALDDACVAHGVAFDPGHAGPAGLINEVVVDRDELGLFLRGWLRKPCAHRSQNRSRKEASGWCDAAVGFGEIARDVAPLKHRVHAGGRTEPNNLCEPRDGREGCLALPAAPQPCQVLLILHSDLRMDMRWQNCMPIQHREATSP